MIALGTFIISGVVMTGMILVRVFQIRKGRVEIVSNHDSFLPLTHFLRNFDRHSVTIFFRVILRIVGEFLGFCLHKLQVGLQSFLSSVQANDVRKEKGAVSFYLKHVSLDKRSRDIK